MTEPAAPQAPQDPYSHPQDRPVPPLDPYSPPRHRDGYGPPPPRAPYKQLRRPTTDRMVAGVASGLGRYFAVDPTLVRVVLAVAAVLTGGLALLAYPVMWFLMPEEPADAAPWPHPAPVAPPAGPPAG